MRCCRDQGSFQSALRGMFCNWNSALLNPALMFSSDKSLDISALFILIWKGRNLAHPRDAEMLFFPQWYLQLNHYICQISLS